MSCSVYDLTEENLEVWGDDVSDSFLNNIDLTCAPPTTNKKPRPMTKLSESPSPPDPEDNSQEEDDNSNSPAPEDTPVSDPPKDSAIAPTNTPFPDRKNFFDVKSPSVKLLLLRQDTSDDGNTRLLVEKIWDLKNPVEIGRRVSQNVEITNGLFQGRLVSRKHAIVYAEEDKVVLCDVGSSHGTFVNGQRVVTFRELRDGDRLSLGQFSNGKAPYIVQIIQGTKRKQTPDITRFGPEKTESKKRERNPDPIDDMAYFIFDGLDNVENRITKRLRVSSAISAVVGGVVGGLSVGCAIVGLANMG